jgi:hypothetical protein
MFLNTGSLTWLAKTLNHHGLASGSEHFISPSRLKMALACSCDESCH